MQWDRTLFETNDKTKIFLKQFQSSTSTDSVAVKSIVIVYFDNPGGRRVIGLRRKDKRAPHVCLGKGSRESMSWTGGFHEQPLTAQAAHSDVQTDRITDTNYI